MLSPKRTRWKGCSFERRIASIALPDVLAIDVLLVVEGRLRDRDATHDDRLELGPRVEGAGAADAYVDLHETRLGRARCPFVGPCPPRPLVERAESRLLVERVDLDDDTVDLIVELDPALLPLAAAACHGLDRLVPLDARIRPEAVPPHPLEDLVLALELEAHAKAHTVDPDREIPGRRDRRVELSERAGGGVARVRRRPLAVGDKLLVQSAEGREGEVDLSAHLEHGRRRLSPEPEHREGDRLDRPQVRRHVLAALPVTPGGAADEDAVLVDERHGRAVDLRLCHVGDRLVRLESLADVLRPLVQPFVRRHLLERAHRCEVLRFLELLGRRRAHSLSRRVRRDELGMLELERSELVEEAVELRVGDLGVVEDVVAVAVVLDKAAKLRHSVAQRGRARGHREARRRCGPGRPHRPRADARHRGSRPRRRRP